MTDKRLSVLLELYWAIDRVQVLQDERENNAWVKLSLDDWDKKRAELRKAQTDVVIKLKVARVVLNKKAGHYVAPEQAPKIRFTKDKSACGPEAKLRRAVRNLKRKS